MSINMLILAIYYYSGSEFFKLSSSSLRKPQLSNPMVGSGKNKRSPTPSESFGEPKYSDEEYFEFDSESSTLRSSLSSSSVNTDNSIGLSPGERAFLKAMERLGLASSDESDEDINEGGDEEGGDDNKGGDKGDNGNGGGVDGDVPPA